MDASEGVRRPIETEGAPAPIGPYSQAVVADGVLYCSGQVPLDPDDGELVEGGVAEQARRCLESLDAVCRAAGTQLAEAARIGIYLTDMDLFAERQRGLRELLLRAVPGPDHRRGRGAAQGRAGRDGRHRPARPGLRLSDPCRDGSVTDTVSLEEIRRARDVVADVARDTQVIESRYLSRTTGGTIALKAENLQRTGSFKLRGALNKIASLDPSVKGVVTGSAGNHGQSLAYAARARGLTATIFMPERAALAKIAAARESGAEIRLTGDSSTTASARPRAYAEAEGLAFVHPFDDPAVIAGQGTIGLELLEEVPDLSRVLVPVGGGGLAAGHRDRDQGEQGRRRGDRRPVALPARRRDRHQAPGRDHRSRCSSGCSTRSVTVDEDAIADAIMLLLERTKLVVEGAGAVGVAALRRGASSRPGPGPPW